MGRSRLGIVVPARNEEKTIEKVVISLKKYGDVLVVDDSSSDRTSFLIKKLKINSIKNKNNLGYEATLLKGIKFFLKKNIGTSLLLMQMVNMIQNSLLI